MLKQLQILFFGSLLLYWGKMLFIPLSVALLISCLLYPVCLWLERHKIHRSLSIIISLSSLSLPLALIVTLLYAQVSGFYTEWPDIKLKLVALGKEVSQY